MLFSRLADLAIGCGSELRGEAYFASGPQRPRGHNDVPEAAGGAGGQELGEGGGSDWCEILNLCPRKEPFKEQVRLGALRTLLYRSH